MYDENTQYRDSCFLVVFLSSVHTSILQTLLLCVLLRHGIPPTDSFLNDLSINVYLWCALKALCFTHLSIAVNRKITATLDLLQYDATYSLM